MAVSLSTVQSILEAKLKALNVTLLAERAPLPPDMIEYGHGTIADNDQLSFELCNDLAEQTNVIWSFKQFRAAANQNPEKPVEPSFDDPAFTPPQDSRYRTDLLERYSLQELQEADQIHRFKTAYHAYQIASKEYQELLLQIRAVRAANNLSHRGYLDFVLPTLQAQFPDFARDFFLSQGDLR